MSDNPDYIWSVCCSRWGSEIDKSCPLVRGLEGPKVNVLFTLQCKVVSAERYRNLCCDVLKCLLTANKLHQLKHFQFNTSKRYHSGIEMSIGKNIHIN